jgi:hypothetical protein
MEINEIGGVRARLEGRPTVGGDVSPRLPVPARSRIAHKRTLPDRSHSPAWARWLHVPVPVCVERRRQRLRRDRDRALPFAASSPDRLLARRLIRRADEALQDTVDYLRTLPDPEFLSVVSDGVTPVDAPSTVTVLDNPAVTQVVTADARAGELFVLNNAHLWVPRAIAA